MSARLTFLLNKRQPLKTDKQEAKRVAKDAEREKAVRAVPLLSFLQMKPTPHMRKRYTRESAMVQEQTNYAIRRIGLPNVDDAGWIDLSVDASNKEEYIEMYIGNYINVLRFYRRYPRLMYTNNEWMDIVKHIEHWYQIREATSIVTDSQRYEEMMFCYDVAKKDAQYCVMYYKWMMAMTLLHTPLPLDVRRMVLSFLI